MSLVKDILTLRCPVCRKAPIFRGPYAMHAECPNCGTKHTREQGYFLGALIFAYVFGAVLMIPTIVILVTVYQMELPELLIIPAVQTILLDPFLFVYSRVIWMYLDRNANPTGWN